MIMAATLKAVAAVARRIMNLEKERWLLNAIRFARNDASCMAVKIAVNRQSSIVNCNNIEPTEREQEVLKMICEEKTAAEIGKKIFLSPPVPLKVYLKK
jgi:hypothetical protein